MNEFSLHLQTRNEALLNKAKSSSTAAVPKNNIPDKYVNILKGTNEHISFQELEMQEDTTRRGEEIFALYDYEGQLMIKTYEFLMQKVSCLNANQVNRAMELKLKIESSDFIGGVIDASTEDFFDILNEPDLIAKRPDDGREPLPQPSGRRVHFPQNLISSSSSSSSPSPSPPSYLLMTRQVIPDTDLVYLLDARTGLKIVNSGSEQCANFCKSLGTNYYHIDINTKNVLVKALELKVIFQDEVPDAGKNMANTYMDFCKLALLIEVFSRWNPDGIFVFSCCNGRSRSVMVLYTFFAVFRNVKKENLLNWFIDQYRRQRPVAYRRTSNGNFPNFNENKYRTLLTDDYIPRKNPMKKFMDTLVNSPSIYRCVFNALEKGCGTTCKKFDIDTDEKKDDFISGIEKSWESEKAYNKESTSNTLRETDKKYISYVYAKDLKEGNYEKYISLTSRRSSTGSSSSYYDL